SCFSVPKNISESNEIGNYFQKLDTLINQHQQKHDKLCNIKKAMLEKMFPKQGKTIPEIRFKGFSGEWEAVTLGDYTTFRRGSFPQPYGNKEWYDGEGSMPFVQVVDVSKGLSLVEDTKQKISVKAQPRSVFVPKGSVVVTLQGTIGRVAITQFDSFVDRTILIFESFSRKTDSTFWAYAIQNKFDLEKKRAPGGTIKTITKDALSSFGVLIPSTEEQIAIGNYFLKLDALTNQHQQQITKLNNIKQACLNKMFV
ncbi:restriction endonuclease subunit S, partial [Cronobacter dublinensis]